MSQLMSCVALLCAMLILFCSLDAVDSSKPHTADNVQWVCARINFGKSRALLRFVCVRTDDDTLCTGKNTHSDDAFRAWARDAFRFSGDVTMDDISLTQHL